jgi:hypothetical protein
VIQSHPAGSNISVSSERIITRFINEAVLAWPSGPICFSDLPDPQLKVAGTEDYTGTDGNPYTRYRIPVVNRAAFPDALFTPAPDLPPCGANPDSSRTWVDANDGEGNRLYGFVLCRTPKVWAASGSPAREVSHLQSAYRSHRQRG